MQHDLEALQKKYFASADENTRVELLALNPMHSLRLVAKGEQLTQVANEVFKQACKLGIIDGSQSDQETANFLYSVLCFKTALIYRTESIQAHSYIDQLSYSGQTVWAPYNLLDAIEERKELERLFPTANFELPPVSIDNDLKNRMTTVLETTDNKIKSLYTAYFLLLGMSARAKGDSITFSSNSHSNQVNSTHLCNAFNEILDKENIPEIREFLTTEIASTEVDQNAKEIPLLDNTIGETT